MAKKRKLRSSEPEAAKGPEQPPPQQDPPPQLQPEELAEETLNQTIPIQSHDQQQTLDITMETKDDEEDNDDEGGEEEDAELQNDGDDDDDGDDEDQTLAQNGGLSAGATNGGTEEADEDDEPVEKLLEPFSREQLLSLVKQAVEKHPDFASNIRSLADADPAHRKIFVHGLGWDTTAETLTSEFGKFGEIEDCKAVTDRVSGKSKGYAFILFKRRSGARAALRQPQKKIGNRTTSSQLASAGPVPAPPPVGSSAAVSAAAAAATSSSEYTQRKIFVSNVSAEVDPAKLLEYFRQFGEVEEGPLGLDRHTGKPKGFALFVYKTLESAKKALEEPHKTFEGLTLHCQKAIDGPKQGKPHHHHNNQQNAHHHHHHGQQNQHFHSRKDKNNKYPGPPGHLMAPSAPAPAPYPGGPQMNPALGQALTALLATQGAQLGIGNLLGGLGGAPVNQQGPPPPVYGNPAAGAYVAQPPMQGGYQNPQMGQGGARPHHPGGPGAPYMGH